MAFEPSENPITNPTRESYTALRPFRFWCQKVLPLVYDDSLSYYELLCKVVDYLNKTMEDVDHMNTDMDTLYSNFQEFQEGTFRIYNELVSYVNSYFDELDVQEEINNKLDAMASSGELTTILSPTIANEVSTWLNEHLTPTSPAVDDTLTISGAAADSKTVGDKLNELKSDLSDLDKTIYGKEAIEYTYTSGSYIRTNNSIVSTNGFGYSNPITVSAGDKVIFTARGYNTVVAMISACDSEGGSIMCVVPCIDSEVHDYEYTVIADGYIVVSFAIDYQRDLVIFRAENLNDKVANIETVTSGLETKITPEYTETADKYIHVNSYIASSSGFAYTSPIPVKNKDHVIVNATGYLDRVAMIATCDANGENITSVVPSQDGVTEYSYTADADGYVMVSYVIRYPHAIVIERVAVNELAGEIETLETRPFISLSLFEHFGVIGDSYASGELYYDSTHDDKYEVSWGQILARKLGTTCTNYSRGGFTTRSYLTDNTKGLGYVLSSDPENIYYLALGINDYYNLGESYLGSLTDITDHTSYADYPDTFYGNYGKIIEQVIAHAPHAKLIMFTTANNNTVPALFNEAIINIANHYGLPYIVQLDDPFFTSPLYTKMVSGHPRAVAYSGMAMAFERLITDAILNNWTYFSDYYAY